MTACVNRKHTKKVAAVITASLVGALSLGVAPMAAVAEEPGIEMQSLSEEEAFAKAEVNYALDNTGMSISDLDKIEFETGGDALYPVIKWVTPKDADNMVNVAKCKQVISYDANGNGKLDESEVGNVNAALGAGQELEDLTWTTGMQYWVSVYGPVDSEYAAGRLDVPFTIVYKSLKGTQVVDWVDHDFTYKKAGQNYAFVLDGADITSMVDVTWFYTNTGEQVSGAPVNAGNYTARLKGKAGTDYAGSTTEVNFTIDKIDLSTAVVSISDLEFVEGGNHIPSSAMVNGESFNSEALSGQLSITWGGAESDTSIIYDKTTYTVNIAPSEKGEVNFTGSTQVTFSIVDDVIDDIYFTDATGAKDDVNHYVDEDAVVVLLDDHKTHIEESDFSVVEPDAKLQIKVYNAEGEEVDFDTVNTTVGTYTVAVRADAKLNEYVYGSDTHIMTVKTRKGAVATSADLVFKYKGDVVDHFEPVTYDGTDVLDDIQTVVRYGDETLVEGTDYEVEVTDENGDAVDEIVNAGTYTITVTSDVYDIDGGNTLVIRVKPIVLTDILLGSDDQKDFGSKGSFIPYTGSEASYYFYYLVDGEEVRISDIVELDHFEFTPAGETDATIAESIVEMGDYQAYFRPVEGVVNYVVEDSFTDNGVRVGEGKVYSDVDALDWGSEEIYKAWDLGYMGGYNGSSVFGKDDSIKRGDVAQVLYNMAGSPEAPNEGETTSDAYVTGFSDVDGRDMYYNKAIAWAKACGIVSGDEGTNCFRPEDYISRQELAKMLAEYTRVTGKYEAADTAVIDEYKDADEVSEWAEGYVAWAIENDIMGVDTDELWPTENITRRAVAIMAVRCQPEELSGSMIPSWPR